MKLNLIEHTYTTDVNLFYEIGVIYTYIKEVLNIIDIRINK